MSGDQTSSNIVWWRYMLMFEALGKRFKHVSSNKVQTVNDAYEITHMWTADMKSNEEWSSQFYNCVKKPEKKIQDLQTAERKELWATKLPRVPQPPEVSCLQFQHGGICDGSKEMSSSRNLVPE